MRRLILSVFIPVVLLASINELKTMTVTTGDGYVEIALVFSSSPSNVHDFMLKNPSRIVVDAADTKYALGSNIFPINQGAVLRVRGSQFKTEPMVARVVVDLKKTVRYDVIRDNNAIKIKVYTTPGKVGYQKTIKNQPGGPLKTASSGKPTRVSSNTTNIGTKKLSSSQSVISVGAKFFYNSRGRRDPFKPVKETSTMQDTLLDIAKAKLIGIVQDSSGYVALVQDKNGNGFILRRGDRIKRGRVVRVTKDMAVFAISDFGFTRTVILKLEKEEVSK